MFSKWLYMVWHLWLIISPFRFCSNLLLRDLTAVLLISACITCFYNSLVVQAFVITYILILLL